LSLVAERVRNKKKGVVIFSGYRKQTLLASKNLHQQKLLSQADLLIIGPYEKDNPGNHPLLASANQELLFLTDRYRDYDFGSRRSRIEFRIGVDGHAAMTGFPGAGLFRQERHSDSVLINEEI
jgi:anaerobic ribonucleoside-triphosphate reductase activating protein